MATYALTNYPLAGKHGPTSNTDCIWQTTAKLTATQKWPAEVDWLLPFADAGSLWGQGLADVTSFLPLHLTKHVRASVCTLQSLAPTCKLREKGHSDRVELN